MEISQIQLLADGVVPKTFLEAFMPVLNFFHIWYIYGEGAAECDQWHHCSWKLCQLGVFLCQTLKHKKK